MILALGLAANTAGFSTVNVPALRYRVRESPRCAKSPRFKAG